MGADFVIAQLEGVLTKKTKENIIIMVNGVGYLVFVPDVIQLPEIGSEISLFIYTYVREDTLDLYGFNSMKERKIFELLLSVSRVGPKAAVSTLSTLNHEQFIKAIMTEDISVLKQISGVGPKTAQRLILELKEKISELDFQSTASQKTGLSTDLEEDYYQALTGLGYSRREVQQAAQSLDFAADLSLEEKIKETLSYLGKEKL